MGILIYETLLLRASLCSLFLLLSGYSNTLQRIKVTFIQHIKACQWFAFVDVQNNGTLLKKKGVVLRKGVEKALISYVSFFMDPIVF
jgi:hypothetical protein